MKPIYALWFSSRKGHCGLVMGQDENTGERKIYIGVVEGSDQLHDAIEILTWGHKVKPAHLREILDRLGPKKEE